MLHRNPLAFAANYFYFRTFRGICEADKVGGGNGIREVNCGRGKIVKDCQKLSRETANAVLRSEFSVLRLETLTLAKYPGEFSSRAPG